MTGAPPAMTAEEHLLLNEVIEKQFGLSFAAAKKNFLESRLRPRLQALHLHRFIDYYLQLQYDLNGEIEHLARLITNNETYFFRETYQFEGLFAEGVERLRQGGPGGGALRILSAGCSSGEEPYTLNIYAQEIGPRGGALRGSIDAFDVDSERLAVARQAVYGASSMRSVNEARRDLHFESQGEGRYLLRAAHREGVHFSSGNILDVSSFPGPGPYDVVFCRNVLIYFSEASFHQAIGNFARVLRRGGLLFLGHSESLIGRSTAFDTVRLERCIAYQKVRQ